MTEGIYCSVHGKRMEWYWYDNVHGKHRYISQDAAEAALERYKKDEDEYWLDIVRDWNIEKNLGKREEERRRNKC